MAALEVLAAVETGGGVASHHQRQVLARWSGWGAVSQVFDRHHRLGRRFLPDIEAVMTPEEINAARQSTLNAHYTSPLVAEAIWTLTAELGFVGGDVLEPGCGPGVFFAAAPADTETPVRMTGVELDPTTARICAAAHPEQTVVPTAMQTYGGSGFAAVVGNVPFADVPIRDKLISDGALSLHNYCIAKSLAAVRPGGLLVAVTSRYTLDAANPSQRKQIARWGSFVGAVRLPAEAFASHSGTSVTTDILVFQRRPERLALGDLPAGEIWWRTAEHTTDDDSETLYRRNRWYDFNPDLVLGKAVAGGMYGADSVGVTSDAELSEAIPALMRKLARRVQLPYQLPDPSEEADRTKVAAVPTFVPPTWAREGSIFATPDGGFVQIQAGIPRRYTRRLDRRDPELAKAPRAEQNADLARRKAAAVAQLAAMCELRDVARDLVEAEQDGSPDVDTLRRRLNEAYDTAAEAAGGPLIQRDEEGTMRRRLFGGFIEDPDCVFLMGLETEGPDGPQKGPAFYRPMTRPVTDPADVDSLQDAVIQSVGRLGRVDVEFMTSVTPNLDWTPDDLTDQGLAYRDPSLAGTAAADKRWIAGPVYLSGDVRAKLAEAQQAAETDERYATNVSALETVVPEFVPASQISVNCGTTLLTPEEVTDMITDTLGDVRKLVVSYNERGGWGITGIAPTYDPRYHHEWGTGSMNAICILDAAWTGRQPIVYMPHPTDPDRRVVDNEATVAAAEKVERWHDRLVEWMFDERRDRSDQLAHRWNERYNRFVSPQFPPEWMDNPPGLSEEFQQLGLYEHQATAAARITLGDDFLLGHCVGAGKTVAMATGVMRMRQLGIRSKPVIVVPNSVVTQFGVEFMRAYPSASILMPPKGESPNAKARQAFAAQSLWGDWDAVIIPHSFFSRLPLRPDTRHRHLEARLDELRGDLERENERVAAMSQRTTSGQRRGQRSVKQIEKQIARARERMSKLLEADTDTAVFWEDFGFDYALVDEAHEFKNLAIESANREEQFEGSKRAEDLLMKIEVLREQHPGRGVVTLATGTPVSNKPSELWVMSRYLAPDLLRASGVYSYDAWAAAFTKRSTRLEPSPVGYGFSPRTRISAYVNLPELRAMIDSRGDIRTADDLGLKRPPLAGGAKQVLYCAPSPLLNGWMDSLAERAGPGGDNKDVLIALITSARRAAVDMSLVGIPPDPNRTSKLFNAASDVARRYHETRHNSYPGSDKAGALQLVFCDLGTPKGDDLGAYGTFAAALTDRGVPPERIELIHNYPSAKDKHDLFRRCRDGDVSVLIGSTPKMGQGVNVQDRLHTLHHLTLPWKPAEIEQREGRILRPGNLNPEVEIVYHAAEGSSDVMQLCILENKDRFIRQFIAGTERVIDACDTDEKSVSYDEMMAFATGDARALEMTKLSAEVANLVRSRNAVRTEARRAKDMQKILGYRLDRLKNVLEQLSAYQRTSPKGTTRTLSGRPLDRKEANQAYNMEAWRAWKAYTYDSDPNPVATVGDVPVWMLRRGGVVFVGVGPAQAELSTSLSYSDVYNGFYAASGQQTYGKVPDLDRRVRNLIRRIPETLADVEQRIPQTVDAISAATETSAKTWPHHAKLLEASQELDTLRADINENPIERELPPNPVPSRLIADAVAKGGDVQEILDDAGLMEGPHRTSPLGLSL